jgi:hypothetical protein
MECLLDGPVAELFAGVDLPAREWGAPPLVTISRGLGSEDEARIRVALHRTYERKLVSTPTPPARGSSYLTRRTQ